MSRCFLVCVSTPTQTSAFRIFSVMNSRGLDLLPIDIIKSDIIGKLPEEEQEEYTKKWEDLENETGREGFNEVFTHTRTIFVKERPKKTLLEEFREGVLSKVTPKSLIDDYLVPYTEAYACLKGCCYESMQNAEEINQYLYWLNRTNNHDWMPPAILFLASNPNSTDFLWFIQKLERLASYLFVTGKDVNQRFDRYRWLLDEIDNDSGLESIELTEVEKKKFISLLNGEIYLMTPWRRNYIIQRLDSFVSAGGATYDTKVFTIEHVLPQNPSPDGEWMRIWPDAGQRRVWLNRIANLVPLTRIKNSAAQNYDFAKKKEKYFQSRRGVTSYALTTQVLGYESWTPEQVEKRQRELLNVFREKWDLAEDKERETQEDEFMIAGRGGRASGYPLDADNFVVKKGSRISSDTTEGLPPGYLKEREQLIQDGIIVDSVFTQDYTFSSASGAAAVVLGRSVNGRREWRRLDGLQLGKLGR